MIILYGHPESGHTYKVALSLALMGEPIHDGMSPDLAQWPSLTAWLSRIRALPAWKQPAALLGKRV